MNETLLQNQIKKQPYPLLFVTVSGAHLYGFPSPDSDYDLRGVHILPLKEVIGLHKTQNTIERAYVEDNTEIDLVTHDAQKFFLMVLKRNGYVLEQIFSPLIIHTTPEHEELKTIVPGCITRHHAHHYLGFSRTQWQLFQKKAPPQVKPLLYVYRVLLTGIHLMQTGEINANLVELNEKFQLSYIPELIERKLSGLEKGILESADVDFHQQEFERLTVQLEAAREKSFLPDMPPNTCKAALNDLLIRLRLSG